MKPDRSIVKLLSARLLGLYLAPPKVNPPLHLSSLKSVLIIRNDALGDAIVTTPVWRTLKRQKPSLIIGVVASSANVQVLSADPDIDHVYLVDDNSALDADTLSSIRSISWDITLCLKYNSKTKSALLARKLAPHSVTSTVAFNDDPRYDHLFSIVSRQDRDDNDHMTDVIRKHLRAVIDVSTQDWHPSISFPETSISRVKELLSVITERDGFLHINLHASLASREWGIENVLSLCGLLREKLPDLAIVVTGDPNRITQDAEELNLKGLAGVYVLPPLDQPELCAVVRASRMVLTPDTSITHIAAAEHKPVVTLHYRKNEWYPYGVPSRVLYSQAGRSVSEISVTEVFQSIQALLATK